MVAVFLLGTPTILADVLVMQDGSRVETLEGWEVKGRIVLFKLPNGTLTSARLSEVDLEASAAATRVTAERRAAESRADEADRPKEPRESVLVLTNESMGLGPEGIVAGPGTGDDTANTGSVGSQGVVTTEGDVDLVEWSYDVVGENPVYEVTGVVANQGRVPAEDVSVYIDIVAVDEETGQKNLDRHILRRARVESTTLAPGASTGFRYPVTQEDLRTVGEEGFSNPVVSFDVQFRKGAAPDEDDLDPLGALESSDDLDPAEDFEADSDALENEDSDFENSSDSVDETEVSTDSAEAATGGDDGSGR